MYCQSWADIQTICPFDWGGRGDDIVCIKRKISYILAKITFKWVNFERGCKQIFLFKDLKEHEDTCGFRVSIWEYWKSPVLSKKLTEHINQWKEIHAKINCQYWEKLISYKEIELHIAECENKPINWIHFPKCLFVGYQSAYNDHIKLWDAGNRSCQFWKSNISNKHILETNESNSNDETDSNEATHDCLEILNDMIRTTIRNEHLCEKRLERRKEEQKGLKIIIDDLISVLESKHSQWENLEKEVKYYKDEVFKVKKRKQKEALKNNDGTLQEEGEDFRICTGKRPYIWFAKNSEIDPILAKDNVWKCPSTRQSLKVRSKNKNWVDCKWTTWSHALCKIWKYFWSQWSSIICGDCKAQCPKWFNFWWEKWEWAWGNLNIKILRT